MAPEMDKIKGSGEGKGHMIILAILLGKMLKYEKWKTRFNSILNMSMSHINNQKTWF